MSHFPRTALALNALFGLRVTIGFLAYALIARSFGTSGEIDAFWIAITPTLVGVNLIEACGVGCAVTYFALLSQEPDDVRRSEVLGFLLAWLAIGAALGVGAWALAEPIVRAMVPGLDPSLQRLAARLVPLASVCLALGPVTYLCFGLLNGEGKFFSAAVVGLLPVTVLLGGQLLGVTDVESLTGWFVGGYVLAAVASLAVLHRWLSLVPLRPTYRRLGAFFDQFLPLLGGAALMQVLLLRERALASHLEVGTISALTYALRIATVAGGLIAAGFDATVAAGVARRHITGDHAGARAHVQRSLAFVALLSLPTGLALILFADEIVALLFGGARFGARSVELTAAALVGYFGVYVWGSVGRVLIPAAVGRRRATSSFSISLVALLSYLVLAPSLAAEFQVGGLAVAASLSYGLATALYAIDLARR
jgi:putative peptidoglycan lipid II flippase